MLSNAFLLKIDYVKNCILHLNQCMILAFLFLVDILQQKWKREHLLCFSVFILDIQSSHM